MKEVSNSAFAFTARVDYILAISPLTMGWASVTMAGDAEERAVITASMNAIGQGIMAGTQVVQYPATSAPNFHGGFCSGLATTIAQIGLITAIWYLSSRDKKFSHSTSIKAEGLTRNISSAKGAAIIV